MDIRRYEERDRDEFRRLHVEFEKLIENMVPPDMMRFEELAVDGIDEWIREEMDPKRCVFVAATDDNKLTGFISGEVDEEPGCRIRKWGVILALFVDKSYRKQGVAMNLYAELDKWFGEQRCRAARVETWMSNDVAMDAYRSMGFIEFYTGFVKEVTPAEAG